MLARYNASFALLELSPPSSLFDELMAAYGEECREYHTAQHLRECFGLYDSLQTVPGKCAAVELALWFHDAVYDTTATDNEARSAEWAERALGEAGVAEPTIRLVTELIMATRHGEEPAQNPEGALIMDIDLGILGAPKERYEEYEEQVRGEYDWVPEKVYCPARAGILRQFLEQPSIYQTAAFRERFEERARRNLDLAILTLDRRAAVTAPLR